MPDENLKTQLPIDSDDPVELLSTLKADEDTKEEINQYQLPKKENHDSVSPPACLSYTAILKGPP